MEGRNAVSDTLFARISAELRIGAGQVARTVALLDEQNTIPFIARYRKEVTGGLDEVQIAAIDSRINTLRALEARRAEVLRLIEEHGKLTPDLAERIHAAETVQALDDLYLPYRPKRRTRAMIARERGLAPLATAILDQIDGERDDLARPFIDPTREVENADAALAGARDIVAETIAEDADVRGELRALYARAGAVRAVIADASKDADGTYAQYYEFSGPLVNLPPHRILALNRGVARGRAESRD